jgi:hypothetical protein
MARARGCDLRAVLAGAIVCWAIAEGFAVAQEGAEVTEDLGNSYQLARRTTGQGSIIETVLFDGLAIVTEIASPALDAGIAAGTTGARTPAGSGNLLPGGAALPPGLGAGFGGTWLTGDVIDDYLVLHRIRPTEPVTHEIFHDGRKVGSVTELAPSIRTGRLAGRNSFAFESTDDRFVVHLTQPDGTTIRATTDHGRLVNQVVERSAALAGPSRFGVGVAAPPERSLEAVGPSIGRSPEPQRAARPQEAVGSIMVEEPAARVIMTLPETVPLPRSSPLPRTRLGIEAVRTASPSAAGNSYRGAPEPIAVAPAIRPRPATTSGNAPAAAAPPRAAASASAIAAPAARPVTAANAALTGRPKSSAVSAQPVAAMPATPIARGPATAAPAVKPKPALATQNAAPSGTARPVAPVARPSRSPLSDAPDQWSIFR